MSASTFAMTMGLFKVASTGAAASNCKGENHSYYLTQAATTTTTRLIPLGEALSSQINAT